MKKEEVIFLFKEDLKEEYKHVKFNSTFKYNMFTNLTFEDYIMSNTIIYVDDNGKYKFLRCRYFSFETFFEKIIYKFNIIKRFKRRKQKKALIKMMKEDEKDELYEM